MSKSAKSSLNIGGHEISLGEVRETFLAITQGYSGAAVTLPITVQRAKKSGPTVLVIAAVHGDELNGTGIVRELILRAPFELTSGSLVLAPVINVLGFERHMRYLPDRRDLNRCFPGSANGSLASRFAHTIFRELITRCNYCIDLHTAAVRRTNFPNVRVDLSDRGAERIAAAFGCEIIVNNRGPKGALRRAACRAGCPTITFEAGEVWKIEPAVVEWGVRGVRNVLIELGMVEGEPVQPPYQVRVDKTRWLRAEEGGILQFHVGPGEVVTRGQPVATNTNLLGRSQNVLHSPLDGIVLGMSTLPAVTPGDPVCHIAVPRYDIKLISRVLQRQTTESLHERTRDDLASSLTVTDPSNGQSVQRQDSANKSSRNKRRKVKQPAKRAGKG